MAEALTLYKLIILYMLRKVSFPLTNAQISDFILGQEYTSYFHLQQAISEMLEADLVTAEVIRNTSYYRMTDEGKKTITYFDNQIPDPIKEDINRYLDENSYELRNEVSVLSDYYKTPEQEYTVRCQVREGTSTLIELNLTVPEESNAKAICGSWSKKSQEIYAYLMNELMI
ncbi:DUF4364 family protein [Ruminococcus sp. OA3]|uniref:DUF4364 family protein n=1 Tax=Ruminococcus sp. OA3 TaxID=2914164 RepID=UPI001F068CC7|nr:DUF4364 family protein [Ruminococcus sp. OA3]MCH1984204.1 DUF4364 family protein [Ruminococcus sp. OA3]